MNTVGRNLSDSEISKLFQNGCPFCNNKITTRTREVIDNKTGKSKFGGIFYGCSKFVQCGIKWSFSVATNGGKGWFPEDIEIEFT